MPSRMDRADICGAGKARRGDAGLYMVQTGIYRVRANAEREVEHLKSQGFPAFMTFKDGLYYVRAGAFRNMENAVRQEQELRKLGYPTLLVKT